MIQAVDLTLRHLFNFDMLKRILGSMQSRVLALIFLAVLFAGKSFEAQEIVTLTSRDGRIVYANTEDLPASADNLPLAHQFLSPRQTARRERQALCTAPHA